MKCFYHLDRDSVASCSNNCGKTLCQECASRFTSALCTDCFLQMCHTEREAASKGQGKALIAILWTGFFCIFGLILVGENIFKTSDFWMGNIPTYDEIKQYCPNFYDPLWSVWGISGLPWIITSGILSKDMSIEAQVRRGIDTHVDPGSSLLMSVFGFLFKIFAAFILGAIASPFILIYSIYKYKNKKKEIADLDELIQRYS